MAILESVKAINRGKKVKKINRLKTCAICTRFYSALQGLDYVSLIKFDEKNLTHFFLQTLVNDIEKKKEYVKCIAKGSNNIGQKRLVEKRIEKISNYCVVSPKCPENSKDK